jgi:hypothetical protein
MATYDDPNAIKKAQPKPLGGMQAPATPNATPSPTAAPDPADPFAAMGGGVKLPNGDWVPANHPGATGQPGAKPDATTYTSGPTTPGGPVQVQPPGLEPAPGQAGPAATPAATPGQPTTVADAFKQSLITMLDQGGQTPSLNDPALKAQSDAYAVGQTRASEAARAQLAERAAQQGGTGVNSGAFDTGIADLLERQGEGQAGFNAGLVGDELKQRRQQLIQAAALAGQSLNAEEARALQRELSAVDAEIRKSGIAQQGRLGEADIALRGRLGEGQLNLGLLSSLMGNDYNNRALSQQGAQFGQGLDTQTLLALIGGL